MDILIIGDTAREHALAWKFAESRRTGGLYCTSPFSGVDTLCTRIAGSPDAWCDTHHVDLTIREPGRRIYQAEASYSPDTVRVIVDCLTDGHNIVPMPAVRIGYDDADGAVTAEAPAREYTEDIAHRAYHRHFIPYIRNNGHRSPEISCVVRFELALCGNEPELLSVDLGFGELDALALLPLLRCELAGLFTACADGKLTRELLRLHDQSSAVLMLGASQTGVPIRGLADVAKNTGVFFGAVQLSDGKPLTAGRRALFVCGRGQNRQDALRTARTAADAIQFDGVIRYHTGRKASFSQESKDN